MGDALDVGGLVALVLSLPRPTDQTNHMDGTDEEGCDQGDRASDLLPVTGFALLVVELSAKDEDLEELAESGAASDERRFGPVLPSV